MKRNVAALEIDPFASGFRRHQDLDFAVPKLLLSVEARTRLVPRARPHAAVDGAYAKAPGLQPLYQVIESVPEFCKDEQPLVRIVEEPLLPHDFVKAGELGLLAGCFDTGGLFRKLS